MKEVLPLEPILMRFLWRHWQDSAEVPDLRQEIYVRVYESARRKRPFPVRPYLILIARNLMIDRIRRKNVVAIDTMADSAWLQISEELPSPEQSTAARQDLRRLQDALDHLPARCREVIVLRRIHGFSQQEVARKMRIKEETVENQVVKGMRMLADAISDKRSAIIAIAKREDAKGLKLS